MKNHKYGIAVLAALALAFINIPAAMADTTQGVLSDIQEQQVQQNLVAHGTSADVAAALVKKIDTGHIPDSMTGAAPVSKKIWTANGYQIERSSYSDGSFEETAQELPASVAEGANESRASITGCTSRTGTGYVARYNCVISETSVLYSAQFRASFIEEKGGGTITSASSPKVNVVAGTLKVWPTVRVVRTKSTSTEPARAEMNWGYEMTGGVSAGTTNLVLEVRSTGSYVFTE